MAVATNAFDPKQFSFLIAEQDDWGTHAVDESSPNNSLIALDVDSIGSPSLGVEQVLDPRSGSRVLQATDFFHEKRNTIKEMTVSGTATTEGLDLLLSNLTADTSSPYAIASNAATSTLTSATANQTDQQLLSIVYKSAYGTNADLSFKDCFCTNLVLSGSADAEGGRVKFSATFKTGSLATDLTDATTTIDTAITSNDYFMSAWDADDRIVAGVANVIVSSFSLNITNDVVFAGVTSTGFESATRSGEISATADFTLMYDSNTAALFETFNNQTAGASQGATLMNHQASLADANIGFKFTGSALTNVAFSEGSLMMIDCSVKALGSGIGSSTALVEVAC
tara:strand:+ start:239 stop:1258 length:1020 start_codon:yes stop_codon:yes gene_type:complete